ncbi:MAG: hypothetical protein HC827_12970 [Cyanobacteria bacterium RM1_2_2]|nr:hypothetical protein [Cyanobacteria bacterium RM1_2_2]
MKSQYAGSLFGALMIASSFALLNVAGLEVPYLKGQAAYAVTSQTLRQSDLDLSNADLSGSELSVPQTMQVARRFRSISR